MKTAHFITIGRLNDHVFKEYNKENKYAYKLRKADLLDNMTVAEFKEYKTKHKSYYFPLVMMMELHASKIDEDQRNCFICIEGKDFNLELEINENEVLGYFNVLTIHDDFNTEEFSENQKEVLIDWFKSYMKEADIEASYWTGDPYKDNGVSMRDFM